MTNNPYQRAQQEAPSAHQYTPVSKDKVPPSLMQNLVSTYTSDLSGTEASKPSQAKNPYQSAQLSPVELRRLQKAEIAKRKAEQRQAELKQQEELKLRQLQYEKEEVQINNFLKNIKRLDPMHPDRRWFEDYKKSCPSERQAALDLIRLSDT